MRWRRRLHQKRRRRERLLESLPNQIVVRHSDGTVQRYVMPKARLPPGARVWNGRGKPPEAPFVMTFTMESTFHKCDVCGSVWQRPHRHTRRECRTAVARQVLEE